MNAVLKRTAFEVGRELEYFTEKELRQQIGYAPEYWPVAILRELIDNALDACEANGVLPEIGITIADDKITVIDNGDGLPRTTLVKSLDYLIRVSDKAHYVSPTRGAMGNALKVIWAAPFVATGAGNAEVIARGEKHCITATMDRIEQRPRIKHTVKPAIVKKGTSFAIRWKNSTCSLSNPDFDFYKTPTASEIIEAYAAFNPHATFILNGERIKRTADDWKKWMPGNPTPAHWYTAETLRDLIAAYVAFERNGGQARTVREFVSEFRGLSATAKQKTVTGDWSRSYLHDFIAGGDLDPEFVAALLERMKAASKAPKPQALGVLGEDRLTTWMVGSGVREESIRYKRSFGEADGQPYVLEIAFGINEDRASVRRIVTGLNWSPTIGGDPDPTLRQAIAQARLDPDDPVTLVVHIARPRFDFADRGKTRLAGSAAHLNDDMQALVKSVTKAWAELKRKADREGRVSQNQLERMLKPARVKINEVAFDVMEDAYNKASSNGRYYANARQIMYAARPAILERCDIATLSSKYFTQTLLKDYLEEFNPDWKVVWDARGHLVEPHTNAKISLGGLGVKQYREQWGAIIDIEAPRIEASVATHGPRHRFPNVLFIEKEGFAEILADAGISERYDMAIMSTKGIPVDAACDLISSMTFEGVRVFVLHDFDVAGFKILRTLRVGTRLSQGADVIDLGLRMADIGDLPSEPVSYSQRETPRHYLEFDCGATHEEGRFLVSSGYSGRYSGRRVEINAMTSEQLITWLERKFAEHGVKKLVPDEVTLSLAYQRAVFLQRMQIEIERLCDTMEDDHAPMPEGLVAKVEATLRDHPRMSWDQALWRVAREESE